MSDTKLVGALKKELLPGPAPGRDLLGYWPVKVAEETLRCGFWFL